MKFAHLAGLAFSLIFGLTFMFSSIALDHIEPIALISYRFLIAFLVFEILRRVGIAPIRFKKENIKAILSVALMQPVLYFLFETYGLNRTTSAEAGMMIALIPIFATIFSSIILKERPRFIQIVFIMLSVSGVIMIQWMNARGGIDVDIIGFILLLFAVMSAGLFNIASRSASKRMRPHEVTYFMMMIGAISFNLIYIVMLSWRGEIAAYSERFLNVSVIGPVLFLGVVASIGAFGLVNFALSRLEVHVSAIYANISTIVAVIAGAVFLNEPIFWYHYLGALMIVGGVYGTVQTNRRHRKRQEAFKGRMS